ncbi:MAG TPA: lactonase family protein [Puia sp.]|nr:lactonase family protein [Puia sp.]
MRWNLTLLLLVSFSSCFSQNPYLFIGTYTNGSSKGIYVYRFNTTTGIGQEISTMPAKNPSYLTVSSDGKHLYATDENDAGGSVGAYAFEPSTGKLAFLNSQSSRGTCACYVAEDKSEKWVFVANYCSGNLAALPVNTDGSLAPALQVIQQLGKGFDTARQEAGHVHSTIFSPDEKFLLTANLGTDQEHVYAFNPTQTIPLTDRYDSVISLTPGTGPRHIAFLPSNNDVFILGELAGTIDAFHFDNQSGKLTHFQKIRTTPETFKGDPGSADIHIRPDGKFLYASNRGTSNTLAVFAIEKDGKLVNKQYISVNGKHPRNFVIDPTGHFLLVANRDSDNIVIFSIDETTGLLTATGKEITIPNPVCLKFLAN